MREDLEERIYRNTLNNLLIFIRTVLKYYGENLPFNLEKLNTNLKKLVYICATCSNPRVFLIVEMDKLYYSTTDHFFYQELLETYRKKGKKIEIRKYYLCPYNFLMNDGNIASLDRKILIEKPNIVNMWKYSNEVLKYENLSEYLKEVGFLDILEEMGIYYEDPLFKHYLNICRIRKCAFCIYFVNNEKRTIIFGRINIRDLKNSSFYMSSPNFLGRFYFT